jgi:hypothetical protein
MERMYSASRHIIQYVPAQKQPCTFCHILLYPLPTFLIQNGKSQRNQESCKEANSRPEEGSVSEAGTSCGGQKEDGHTEDTSESTAG